MITNVIWIDSNIYNKENADYIKELRAIRLLNLKLFNEVNQAFNFILTIEFKETIIIINDALYSEFVKKFQEKILNICVAPKIIVFTKNKDAFIEHNNSYNNSSFYSFISVATSFTEIKMFLKKTNENEIKEKYKDDNVQLTFEYIEKIEQLVLPIFFKSLIDIQGIDDIKKYTESLYQKFAKGNYKLEELLGSIVSLDNIPIEILSKYYARLYTAESVFHKTINEELGSNEKEKYLQYLTYIKILYEGVKLKSLPLSKSDILYRGSKISNKEIEKIKDYIKIKKEGLPSSIVFSKSFLSFSKDINQAINFLCINNNRNDKDLSNVLFILTKDDSLGYNLATHGDIEKISFFPKEKEILFFPFSSFEIKEITYNEDNKRYEIKLLYLGKYLKEIKDNENLLKNPDIIPDSDFKKQFIDCGFIKDEIVENLTTNFLYERFTQYEKVIQRNNNNNDNINKKGNDDNRDNNNIITGEIRINKEEKLDKDIRIINYCENKEEIEENVKITINDKIIGFSYYHKFKKLGNYKIKYIFKNSLTNLSCIFWNCEHLTNLNLSQFNTKNAINMYGMFRGCRSLQNINLENLDTQNVSNMSGMFFDCKALFNLNLSYFNTKNVSKMGKMFSQCISLTTLDLSNFNTENVTDMSYMFSGCNSLKNLNLSNFNTQNVTDMSYMFLGYNLLTNLDLSKFNTQNVKDMSHMFSGCKSIKNLDLSNFNTQNVTDMSYMFYDCISLISLNLSNFSFQNVTVMGSMFNGCNILDEKYIKTKDKKILKVFRNG